MATVAEQEAFDAFAGAVTSEAADIANAVAVVASEIEKLKRAVEAATGTPLDTSKSDAAIAALTGSVNNLQALEPEVVEEPTPEAPVEPEVPEEDQL